MKNGIWEGISNWSILDDDYENMEKFEFEENKLYKRTILIFDIIYI